MNGAASRTAFRRLLVACALTDGSPVDPAMVRDAADSLDVLPRACAYHGIGPGAWLALADAGLPDPVADQLRSQHHHAVLWHMLILQQLARVGDALDRSGIAWATLKGPLLSETLYPRPDIRRYADLDVLVEPSRFPDAVEAVAGLGGQVIEHDWRRVLHEVKGELNVALRGGGVVDLHWSLLYDEELRRSFGWRDHELLDRRRKVALPDGTTLPTLDPVDTLLHLVVHACLAGGQRLSWMRDVRLAAAAPGMDVAVLVDRARDLGVALPAGVMLRRVRRVMGLDAFDHTVDDRLMGASRWPLALAVLDRLRPPSAWHGGQLSGHIVLGSTRRDTAASVRQLRRRVGDEIAVLRHDRNHPWLRRLHLGAAGSAPGLAAPPRSEPAFRAAYLAAVASRR